MHYTVIQQINSDSLINEERGKVVMYIFEHGKKHIFLNLDFLLKCLKTNFLNALR